MADVPYARPANSYDLSGQYVTAGTTRRRLAEKLAEMAVSLKDRGAVGDNATDDTSSIQARIDALPASGGKIFVGRGIYNFSSLDFRDKAYIHIVGDSFGSTGIAPASILYYGETGTTGTLIDCGSSRLKFENICFIQGRNGFTGTVLKAGRYAAGSNSDSVFLEIDNCQFLFGSTTISDYTHLDISDSHSVRIRNTIFIGGGTAIQGRTSSSLTSGFSNAVTIEACYFNDPKNIPIAGGGTSWSVEKCTFEGYNNGTSGNKLAGAVTSSFGVEGFRFVGNWMGDTNTSGGTWVNLVDAAGLEIAGNEFAAHGSTSGSNAIQLNGAKGFKICANRFRSVATCLNFASNASEDGEYANNKFLSVGAAIANTSLWTDYNSKIEYMASGKLKMWGTVSVTPGTPASVTLPKTLTASPEMVLLTIVGGSVNGDQLAYASSLATTGFSANVAGTNSGSVTVHWQAIGTYL